MKTLKLISFLLFTLFTLFGCNRENEPQAPTYSDVSWYTEAGGFAHNNLVRNIGESMAFMDLSQGVNTHEWILDSGNYFIEGNFQRGDDLRDFIIPESGANSEEYSVNVLFTEGGLQGVRLNNTFYNPVTYIGLGADGNADTLVSFQRPDGMWEIDTTFYVDVYAVLEPRVQIENDGKIMAEISVDSIYIDGQEPILYDPEDNTTWPSLTVPLGEGVVFRDVSTVGRPQEREWIFPKSTEIIDFEAENVKDQAENSPVVTLKFIAMKEELGGAITVAREKPDAIAATQRMSIPLVFNPQIADVQAAFAVVHKDVVILTINADDQPSTDESTWEEITIEKGDNLQLVDLSTKGLLNYDVVTRLWTFDDATTSTDSIAYVVYNELTDGENYHTVGKFKVSRAKEGTIPAGEDEKVIPLKVKVALEARPTFKDGDIVAIKNEISAGVTEKVITFPVSENLKNIVDQDVAKGAFTVTVTNQEAGFPATVFDIASVQVNASNRKQIELRLTNDIYNTDNITVVYSGEANNAISSEAGVSLEDFGTESVTMYGTANILNTEMASFELEKDVNAPYASGWYNQQNVTTWNRTDEKSSTGSYGVKFYAENQAALHKNRDRMQSVDSDQSINETLKENDQVRISFDIFIPVSNTMTDGLSCQFINPVDGLTKISTASDARGVWVTKNIDFVMSTSLLPPSGKTSSFAIQLSTNDLAGVTATDAIEFYIDNINIRIHELRP
ncbi:SwmB domain-containing protein [Flammeovirga kamogawensis]|uniref:Uncharacterized protein n=1 Tax=Flammeovirga kamogawensis TaxID=373891 RepID=A0ABX8H4I3_9BACT|nr:SwmB domain-containing protein [Flammeovirga kamogawensis]MBB6463525.1 hypothetical protein [Flammeovirga kamogawensis]QWG10583.1 hypothetical protein KM029_24680 [Flammeovirga kamogawensis]TRX63689.1 hypothetical protein EO216_25065 [Flammeovirga kamogawensis]